MEEQTVNEGKTYAIISYFWVIGTVIAWALNSSKKNKFASFHIRQMIGINLLSLLNRWVIYTYIGSTVGWVIGVILFVLWVIGFIGALKGEEKRVPIVGDQFQEWFKTI